MLHVDVYVMKGIDEHPKKTSAQMGGERLSHMHIKAEKWKGPFNSV